jgi:hypothetical protein
MVIDQSGAPAGDAGSSNALAGAANANIDVRLYNPVV